MNKKISQSNNANSQNNPQVGYTTFSVANGAIQQTEKFGLVPNGVCECCLLNADELHSLSGVQDLVKVLNLKVGDKTYLTVTRYLIDSEGYQACTLGAYGKFTDARQVIAFFQGKLDYQQLSVSPLDKQSRLCDQFFELNDITGLQNVLNYQDFREPKYFLNLKEFINSKQHYNLLNRIYKQRIKQVGPDALAKEYDLLKDNHEKLEQEYKQLLKEFDKKLSLATAKEQERLHKALDSLHAEFTKELESFLTDFAREIQKEISCEFPLPSSEEIAQNVNEKLRIMEESYNSQPRANN